MHQRHDEKSPFEPLTTSQISKLLDHRPSEVFKSDHRSKVWLVDDEQGGFVIKRFEYTPWRQQLGWLFGLHPAQREVRANRWIGRQGIPVVPVVGVLMVHGKLHLVTRFVGPTLVRLAEKLQAVDECFKRGVVISVGRIVSDLVSQGVYFRDLKTSNVVVDDQGRAWLIDTGSARRSWEFEHAVKMIAMLEHTCERDGIGSRMRLRCLRIAVLSCERLGRWRSLVEAIRQVVVQYGARQMRDEKHLVK